MIPRYQRVLFWVLSISSLLMVAFLLHGCVQAREKLNRRPNETPLTAPVTAQVEKVRLALADDATGRIVLTEREVALSEEEGARALGLLSQLIVEYSAKNSSHPLEGGPAIDDVFLLDLPLHPAGSPVPRAAASGGLAAGPQLAVINLRGSFAEHHPSGIAVETLTISSIVGTIYANFPRIQQIRFVVDGHARDTLAGHADLTCIYRVTNTESRSPSPEDRP